MQNYFREATSPFAPLQAAIVRLEEGVPISAHYEDVYFSKLGGIEESRYVFLHANQLEQRFAALDRPFFSIAELGTGTGLNLLLAAELFLRHAPTDARLHLWSVEKHPIPLQALHAIWQKLQESTLQPLKEEWLRVYPMLTPAAHQLQLAGGRVQLTLCFGEVMAYLPHLRDASIDAWFLDGFAPAKNPDMWDEAVLQHIARCTAPNGTLATFTAASAVRRGLEAAGVAMQKQRGFGHKRDMLTGRKPQATGIIPQQQARGDVLVIGAGIAGASVAYACAMQGMRVRVLERHAEAAMEASGNPAGILYPYMASKPDAATAFYLQGFSHIVTLLRQLEGFREFGLCGMQHHPKRLSPDETARLQALPEALGLQEDIAIPTDYGLYMPQSGWVNVPALVKRLLQHPLITCDYGAEVQHIHHQQGVWHTKSTHGTAFQTEYLVLANAYAAATLLPEHHLPLRKIRGQITYLPDTMLAEPITHVLCHQGYVTPAIQGIHYVGATFDKGIDHLEVTEKGHRENLSQLQQRFSCYLPEMPELGKLQGRAAFRTVSGDRMPVIGACADVEALASFTSRPYRKQAEAALQVPRLPRCYMTLAHGARGLVSAPLAGTILAAEMAGMPLPAHPAIMQMLDPARFTLRAWRHR